MRLVTFEKDGGNRLGALVDADARIVDLALAHERQVGSTHPALTSMQALIEAGPSVLDVARNLAHRRVDDSAYLTSECRLKAPLPRPVQLRDFLSFPGHVKGCRATVAELIIAGSPDPASKRAELMAGGYFDVPKDYFDFPIYYVCNRMAVLGDGDDVVWPEFSTFIDYELEWAAVIGRQGERIGRARAAQYIFGYTIFNDWSARDEQSRAMGSSSNAGPNAGKDFANSLGPCIVTADEIPDPYDLSMKAYLNGELVSEGSTSEMHYGFDALIEYLTRGHAIYPGEVIGSGTVGGGCSLETKRPILDGAIVELEVQSIGRLRNRVVAPHVNSQTYRGFDDALARTLKMALRR